MNTLFRNEYLTTYLIQFSQICNMIVLALCVPYIIGFEEYGKYAGVYSIPGFFQGMIETYLMLLLVKKDFDSNIKVHVAKIYFISCILIVFLNVFMLNIFSSTLSLLLFSVLIFRSITSTVIYTNPNTSTFQLIIVEIVSLVSYVFILIMSIFMGFKSYLMPYYMVIFSSLTTGIYLYHNNKRSFSQTTISTNNSPIFEISILFARIYEDLFLTIAPLVMLNLFGAKIAGQYRFLLSIFKAFSKLFPFRYELILRAIKQGAFDFQKFRDISFYFCIGGVGIFFLFKYILSIFKIDFPENLYLCIASIGPVITIVVIYPMATLFIEMLPIITIFLFISLFSLTYWLGFQAFSTFFLLTNLLLYIFIIYFLNKINVADKLKID